MPQLLGQACRDGADIAGTHGEQQIAVRQQTLEHRQEFVRRFDKYRFDTASTSYSAGNGPAIGTGNRIFTGGIDFEQYQDIGVAQHGREVVAWAPTEAASSSSSGGGMGSDASGAGSVIPRRVLLNRSYGGYQRSLLISC